MESSGRQRDLTVYAWDDFLGFDRDGKQGRSAVGEAAQDANAAASVVACHVMAVHLPVSDVSMTNMPGDIWRVVATHLTPSDTMSVRCTAQAVRLHLMGVSNAIQFGCAMLVEVMRYETAMRAASEVIERFQTVSVDVRSNMIKRYAKRAGMACFADSISFECKSVPVTLLLKSYYSRGKVATWGTYCEHAATSWCGLVEKTKSALRRSGCDLSRSVALSDLYAAQMYAPLLGVISNIPEHCRQVIDDALHDLSKERLLDFLDAVVYIRPVCETMTRAYDELSVDFDRRYPMPSIKVLTEIVFSLLKSEKYPCVWDRCVNRLGLDPDYLKDHIVPRVADRIVEALLLDRVRHGFDVCIRLQRVVALWGGNDEAILDALHRSFLTALSKKQCDDAVELSTITQPEWAGRLTNVMDPALGDSSRFGARCQWIAEFWGVYFDVVDVNSVPLGRRVESLPWPLQAVLWGITADLQAEPERAIGGRPLAVRQEISAEAVETICTNALKEGRPMCALPALLATLRWQVTRACKAASDSGAVGPAEASADLPPADPYLVFSQAGLTVLERCSSGQRLPVVAALFGYRNVLKACGFEWQHEDWIAETVMSFLYDPASALMHPANEIIDVVLHYLPSCDCRLPENALTLDALVLALSKRLDIPPSEIVRALMLERESHARVE